MIKGARLSEGFIELMQQSGLVLPPIKTGKLAQPGIMTKAFLAKAEDSPNAKANPPTEAPTAQGEDQPEKEVRDALIKNPEINGATLLNQIKAKGLKIVADPAVTDLKDQKQADGVSSHAPSVRAGVKKESAPADFTIRAHFKESSPKDNGIGYTKFDVILIQEGLGNFRDAYYYTRQALEGAIPTFEGKKIYADHPSEIDEQVRPERSVKDILGHFENVRLEEVNGQSMLCASVQILPDRPYDWARALMAHSVEYAKKYPDKDFVGLSINASGDAQEMAFDDFLKSTNIPDSAAKKLADAQAQGVQTVRVVSQITDAVSVDLVTEAGAGGRIRSMLEENRRKKEKNMNKEQEGMNEDSVNLDAGKNGPSLKEDEAKKKEGAMPPGAGAKPDADGDSDGDKKEDDKKPAGEEAPAATGDHADQAQDEDLIKKMLDKYIGPATHPEEYMKAAKEALGHAKSSGMDEDEAMKCAGYSMKMAHAIGKGQQAPAQGADQAAAPSEAAKPKEAAKPVDEITKLKGEIAALKETIATSEAEKHLDKVLRESGLKMDVTKKFRETLGQIKSVKVIDEKFKLFLEGYKLAGSGEATNGGFHLGDEKGATTTESSDSFADCVK